jgi:hypothetical protein
VFEHTHALTKKIREKIERKSRENREKIESEKERQNGLALESRL